jgi:hypothetical protein
MRGAARVYRARCVVRSKETDMGKRAASIAAENAFVIAVDV